VTFDAKWKPGTPDYEVTPPKYPAELTPKLKDKLEELAKQAFRLLGCRDYARVDFRVRPPARPYSPSACPNPDFSPLAGLSGPLDGQRAAGGNPYPLTKVPPRDAATRACEGSAPLSDSGRGVPSLFYFLV